MMELLLVHVLPFIAAILFAVTVRGWGERFRKAMEALDLNDPHPSELPPITVLVPVRNGEATIVPLLQDLYAQDLPRDHFRVLVVNDGSTDRTAQVVQGMQARWPGLLYLEARGAGKKAAITTGVESMGEGVVVLTDADVRCGPSRLSVLMQEWVRSGADLLLMPVVTEGGGTVVGRLQEEEQAALSAVGAAEALEGRAALANGANMAFSVASFRRVGGYEGDPYASGDDIFLLQRMRKEGLRVHYLLDRRVVVRTAAEPTWSGFWRQRLRWAGKMRGTSMKANLLPFFVLLFPFLLIALTLHVSEVRMGDHLLYKWLLLLATWALWLAPVPGLVAQAKRFTHQRHAPIVAWCAFIAFTIYAPVVAVASMVHRPQWKGRRIR
ncbi:MAG TPA: glycosyltransferase [Flavobacteriales bacterium]